MIGMQSLFDEDVRAGSVAVSLTPRDYQIVDHDESFRLWDSGEKGVLTRAFTGAGKTLMSCMKAGTWLNRSTNHRVMIVSYEQQLVWQFAQEVYDYLGIMPGIEMAESKVSADAIPPVVVASRQSLLRAKQPTEDQIAELRTYGVTNVGAAPERRVKSYLDHLKGGGEGGPVLEDIDFLNQQPEAFENYWSRLHKFSSAYDWLVCFDEAHRHAHKLLSVGHIVEWFERNPASRRSGMTATPKRADGVSLGDRMFPAVSLDYPLFAIGKKCAVSEGWAVPYRQKYISVEGVDFRQIKKIAGDFDEADLERVLGDEETVAKLVSPLLDLVGDRRTLIFSPGVEMAKNVARFINARSEAKCSCGAVGWYPNNLIGDGAACKCGNLVDPSSVTKSGDQAAEIDGDTPYVDRKATYAAHQSGQFQFLSVCGLCREGYNDREISCVAIFRPVSKKASSLAEQMKGRGCRPLPGLVDGLASAEERLAAIAGSRKPDCLIVDLVGVTGLEDCASTLQIYSEGLPDEVRARAEEILDEEDGDVAAAIERAQKEDDEVKEKIREEREAAEAKAKAEAAARARADAKVKYAEHDVGYSGSGPLEISEKQRNFIAFLGMDLKCTVSKGQAGRIISMLKQRMPVDEVATHCGLREGQWAAIGPTVGQIKMMAMKGIPTSLAKTKYDASVLIEARVNPPGFEAQLLRELSSARDVGDIEAASRKMALVRGVLDDERWRRIVERGASARKAMS